MLSDVQQAAHVLRAGGLILYPTDTVWGVGCDATNDRAVEKIFALKQRARHKSLIVLVSGLGMATRYVHDIPDKAYDLTAVFSTPLTLVYPQAYGLARGVVAGDGSVAIRVVRHFFCRTLLRTIGKPLISTSANTTGQPVPATFDAIDDVIKRGCNFIVNPQYEGAPTRRPSTVIKIGPCGEIEILRT